MATTTPTPKTEKENYQEKFKFWQQKKDLIQERMRLLRDKIVDSSQDELQKNAYRMEELDLQASLEGVDNYYGHYYERLQSIDQRDAALSKECDENYQRFYETFNSISASTLKQHSSQIQEQYNKIIAVMDKEYTGPQKVALYSLMKELLKTMKKI